MARLGSIGLRMVVLTSVCLVAFNLQAQQIQWVVDPKQAGSTLPAKGHSLFDQLTVEFVGGQATHHLPFPFSELLAKLNQHFVSGESPAFTSLLIPIGRSLQRFAGDPDYFQYPRVVIAFDKDLTAKNGYESYYLKDRLFIGYSEATGILEVISYNEFSGRFEFQKVENYRPNSEPTVYYVERSICIACHQNHAPLFSRPEWDETNANPHIAALLEQTKKDFYSLPVRQGLSRPESFDAATDRANLFSLYQLLWRDGCGNDQAVVRQCRAQALLAALQFRLGGSRSGDHQSDVQKAFDRTVSTKWPQLWPQGLAISNPNIPNRRPVTSLSDIPDDWKERIEAQGEFLPSHPRAAVAKWTDYRAEYSTQLISGLATFFTQQDILELDGSLHTLAADTPETHYHLVCRVRLKGNQHQGELRLRCAGEHELEAYIQVSQGNLTSGRIRRLDLADHSPLSHLVITAISHDVKSGNDVFTFRLRESASGLHARLGNGNELSRLEVFGPVLTHEKSQAQITLTVKNDFYRLQDAIDELANRPKADDALSSEVFNRQQLLSAIYTQLTVEMPVWLSRAVPEAPTPRTYESLSSGPH